MKYYFVVIALLLSACSSQEAKKELSVTSEVNPTFENLCYQLADSFNAKDTSLLKENFDSDLAYKQTFGNINSTLSKTKPSRKKFDPLMSQSLDNFSKILGDTEQWYVISVQNKGNNSRCNLHSDVTDSGVFILSIHMRKKGSSEIVFTNWYDYIKAALATDQIREIITDISHALTPADTAPQVNVLRLLTYYKAVQDADIKQAWKIYNTLDDKVFQKKVHLTSLLQVTASSPEYSNKSYELYLKYVDKEDYSLMLIDYFFEIKAFDKALSLIDTIAEKQGESAITELLRANVYLTMGDKKQFYHFMYKSMDHNYNFEDIYWNLFEQFIVDKHYKNAILTLDVLVQNFGYTFTQGMFNEYEEYSDFISGNAYKTWLKKSF